MQHLMGAKELSVVEAHLCSKTVGMGVLTKVCHSTIMSRHRNTIHIARREKYNAMLVTAAACLL